MKLNMLKAERELRGWSQSKVAELLGTTAKTVGRWERGETMPYPHYREQLCTLFGKDAQQLGWQQDEHTLETQGRDADNLTMQVIAAESQSLLPPALTDPSLLIDPAIPQALEKPHSLLGRQHLLTQIKQRLFATDNLALTAFNSLPGVGKTVLAVAVATDRQIQAYFDDGILWARLGPHPNTLGQLIRWATLLGITPSQVENVKSPQAWSQALQAAISSHRLLIIIEDAWTAEDAMTLQIGGPACTHLLTTHLPQVAQAFAEQNSIVIPPLEETDALTLLACFIPQLVQQDPKRSQALVRALNCLPLALTLMGKYLAAQTLAGQPQSLQAILAHLHKIEQRLCVSRASASEELSLSLVDTMPLSLHATIVICDQYLSPQAHSALCTLSIFASKPDSFSKEAILAISQQSVETLDELLNTGLLESWGPEHYTLHQTIADYTRAQPKAPATHQPLSHAVVEDIKLNKSELLSSTDPLPLQNIAIDDISNKPMLQPSHRLFQLSPLITSILFICALVLIGILAVNKFYLSDSAFSNINSQITRTAIIDDSIQGIGTNEFNYVGTGWKSNTHQCNRNSCPYNKSNSWDKIIDDYVSITFIGVQIRFYGVVDPWHGIGAISIDGSPETMIDFYATIRQGDQLLWTSPLLPAGTHTFKLRVTGNKNPSSFDTFVAVDRVDILS